MKFGFELLKELRDDLGGNLRSVAEWQVERAKRGSIFGQAMRRSNLQISQRKQMKERDFLLRGNF